MLNTEKLTEKCTDINKPKAFPCLTLALPCHSAETEWGEIQALLLSSMAFVDTCMLMMT